MVTPADFREVESMGVASADFREIESMGIAYDGSPPADRALKVAAEVSAKTKWPLTTLIITEDAKLAADLTAKVEGAVEPYDIDNDVVILKGKADREIMNFIKEGAVELMVMGAHSRSRLRELFLGSTTAHVIRSSPIPALIIR